MAQEMHGKVVAVHEDTKAKAKRFYLFPKETSEIYAGVCIAVDGFNVCVADGRLLRVGETILRVNEHVTHNRELCLYCSVVHAVKSPAVGDAVETIEKFS